MATRRLSATQQPPRAAASKMQPVATPAVTTAVHSALDSTRTADSASSGKNRKRRATAQKKQAVIAASAAPTVTEDQRRGMIALSAYLRAERRGFSPEGQAEDWLAAENEVDALLNSRHTAPQ